MDIPLDALTISTSHSGGPGGQNVNKVATKVEVRFRLDEASWISEYARRRLRELEARRVTRDGELVVVSSRYRSRERNLDDCLEKIRAMVRAASRRPTPRRKTRPTRASKKRRLEEKKRRADVKRRRRPPRGDDG